MRSCPVAVLVAVLAVVAAPACLRPASAKGQTTDSGDSIRAEIKGQLRTVANARGEHTGFEISANGVTWQVDVSGDKRLLDAAERLGGKIALVTGTYREQDPLSQVRRILTAQALDAATGNGRAEYVDVTVRGTLRTGIMAIGAETTGVTITADSVTWEVELSDAQSDLADTLSGRKVTLSGELRQQRGVEIRSRWILRAQRLAR